MPTRQDDPKGTGRVSGTATNKSNTPKANKVSVDGSEATLHYEISLTKKTGDYEYIKLTAGAEVPVGASDALLKQIAQELVVTKDMIIKRLEADLATIGL